MDEAAFLASNDANGNGFYGVLEQSASPTDATDLAIESVRVRGWGIVPGFLAADEVSPMRDEVGRTYQQQLDDLGRSDFDDIRDSDIARGLALYSQLALDLAVSERMMSLVEGALGGPFLLYTNNGVLNPPQRNHEQRRWHRNLNYQHWVSDRPLGISVLVALDDFSDASGGTQFITGSHQSAPAPSSEFAEAYAETACARAGDAVIFNSMIFHRAGCNSSLETRVAINHVYATPIAAQQVRFFDHLRESSASRQLSGRQLDVLGRLVDRPSHPLEWRRQRLIATSKQ